MVVQSPTIETQLKDEKAAHALVNEWWERDKTKLKKLEIATRKLAEVVRDLKDDGLAQSNKGVFVAYEPGKIVDLKEFAETVLKMTDPNRKE